MEQEGAKLTKTQESPSHENDLSDFHVTNATQMTDSKSRFHRRHKSVIRDSHNMFPDLVERTPIKKGANRKFGNRDESVFQNAELQESFSAFNSIQEAKKPVRDLIDLSKRIDKFTTRYGTFGKFEKRDVKLNAQRKNLNRFAQQSYKQSHMTLEPSQLQLNFPQLQNNEKNVYFDRVPQSTKNSKIYFDKSKSDLYDGQGFYETSFFIKNESKDVIKRNRNFQANKFFKLNAGRVEMNKTMFQDTAANSSKFAPNNQQSEKTDFMQSTQDFNTRKMLSTTEGSTQYVNFPTQDLRNQQFSQNFYLNEQFLKTDQSIESPQLADNQFDMEYMKSIMTKTQSLQQQFTSQSPSNQRVSLANDMDINLNSGQMMETLLGNINIDHFNTRNKSLPFNFSVQQFEEVRHSPQDSFQARFINGITSLPKISEMNIETQISHQQLSSIESLAQSKSSRSPFNDKAVHNKISVQSISQSHVQSITESHVGLPYDPIHYQTLDPTVIPASGGEERMEELQIKNNNLKRETSNKLLQKYTFDQEDKYQSRLQAAGVFKNILRQKRNATDVRFDLSNQIQMSIKDQIKGRLIEIENARLQALRDEFESRLPYQDPYQEVLREEDLQNLPPAMRKYKSKISPEMRQVVGKTCQDVDQRIIERKLNYIKSRREFQDPNLIHNFEHEKKYIGRDFNRDERKATELIIDQEFRITAFPSPYERRKYRDTKAFNEKISKKQKEIVHLINQDLPQEDVLKLSKGMRQKMGKSILPDPLMKQFDSQQINPETAGFLNKVMHKKYEEEQKVKMKTNLNGQMRQLKIDEFKFKSKFQYDVRGTDLKKMQTQFIDQICQEYALEEPELPSQNLVGKKLNSLLGSKSKRLWKVVKAQRRDAKYYWKVLRAFVFKTFRRQRLDIGFLSRVVIMQQKLNIVLGEPGQKNLGQYYVEKGKNPWNNAYHEFVRTQLAKYKIEYDVLNKREELVMVGADQLFIHEMQKLKFYAQAKERKLMDENDPEEVANKEYVWNCFKLREIPLPAFIRLTNNCLFLAEFRISDCQALALKVYLEQSKDFPGGIVKKLFIDDCGMSDHQFSLILDGIRAQGDHIKTIVYANNELGKKSMESLMFLVPYLREIQINNAIRVGPKLLNGQIIQTCLGRAGVQLQKLKLSNTNLNQDGAILMICQMLRKRPLLTHLDLSWCKLLPKHLLEIASTLNENFSNLRNLNIAYNCLQYDREFEEDDQTKDDEEEEEKEIKKKPVEPKEKGKKKKPEVEAVIIPTASEQFIEKMCEYVSNPHNILNHLDLSGMSFNNEALVTICTALANNENLQGIHLSDNGLRLKDGQEMKMEILDLFIHDVDDHFFDPVEKFKHKINRVVSNTKKLKQLVRDWAGLITATDVNENTDKVNTLTYKKHILQTKQGRTIQNNKIINQTQTSFGIGRRHDNEVDSFVLHRKVNHAELIFNQTARHDTFFAHDGSEDWQLDKTMHCCNCEKHRYTMIYYVQDLDAPNSDLIEITNQDDFATIRDSLNLNFRDQEDIAPFIVGTVCNNGGFSRKLKMLRGDLFALLCVAESRELTPNKKFGSICRKGALSFALKNQANILKETLEYTKGWELVLYDKCKRNTAQDIQTINMPEGYDVVPDGYTYIEERTDKYGNKHQTEHKVGKQYEDCNTFVYAAYLPPGLHQFIIYCPVTQRVFCKDVMVNLNSFDDFPDFPGIHKPPIGSGGSGGNYGGDGQKKKKKATRANVWRRWRVDTLEDLTEAYTLDVSGPESTFQPDLFMKSPADIEECREKLFENFSMIQVAYLEGLIDSPLTYPEMSAEAFMHMMQRNQDEKMQKDLPKAQIELGFIRATRDDAGFGLGGTLCRGEFLETILRMVKAQHDKEPKLACYLDQFLHDYIYPVYSASTLIRERELMRESKRLNQLLYDNAKGLRMLYTDNSEVRGFTFASCEKLFNAIQPNPMRMDEPLVHNMRHCFVGSKMTNLLDLEEGHKYDYLNWTEFLELLCRMSMSFHDQYPELMPFRGMDIDDQVFFMMEKLWAAKKKIKTKKKKGTKKKKLPELIQVEDEYSDSD